MGERSDPHASEPQSSEPQPSERQDEPSERDDDATPDPYNDQVGAEEQGKPSEEVGEVTDAEQRDKSAKSDDD